MIGANWFSQLQALVARHSGSCVESDLSGLTLAEAWGVYRFLSSLSKVEGDER